MRGFRRAWDWLNPGTLVLMYHRVADLPTDPFGLCVTPRSFAEQMEVLRERARPVALAELARAHRGGTVPRRGVVVTFDDGYADNLEAALPVLERHEVPATVFIATGAIGSRREFWWDRLERIAFRPGPPLPFDEAGGRLPVGEPGASEAFDEDDRLRHLGWRFSDAGDPHPRHRLYRSLYFRLQAMPPEERDATLDRLGREAGVSEDLRPEYRAMTGEELARLASGRLVEIGAHTVNHPLLPAIDAGARSREIRESKRWLEEALGRRVVSFAYPYGGLDEATAAMVAGAGFDAAVTTSSAVATARDGRFALPRVVVEDLDGDAFARLLDGWFSGRRPPS